MEAGKAESCIVAVPNHNGLLSLIDRSVFESSEGEQYLRAHSATSLKASLTSDVLVVVEICFRCRQLSTLALSVGFVHNHFLGLGGMIARARKREELRTKTCPTDNVMIATDKCFRCRRFDKEVT